MGVMILIMLLTVADVFLRYTFDAPISGATEMTEVMMTGLLLAMAWAAFEGSHITVDIIMNRTPKRVQAVMEIFTFLICLGIFVIIAWQGYEGALYSFKYNRSSALLKIPDGPFYITLAVGFGLLCLSIIPLWIKSIAEAFRK